MSRQELKARIEKDETPKKKKCRRNSDMEETN
jgi:hypothetical protein